MRTEHSFRGAEARAVDDRISVIATPRWQAGRNLRSIAPSNVYDFLTWAFLSALVVVAWLTLRDYAISNDEGLQQRYGELIIAYYRSGFTLRDLFTFDNLYHYGALFDVPAV